MEDEDTMTMLYKVTDGAVEDKNYGAHMIAPILLSPLFSRGISWVALTWRVSRLDIGETGRVAAERAGSGHRCVGNAR